jgi:hypothetical protein
VRASAVADARAAQLEPLQEQVAVLRAAAKEKEASRQRADDERVALSESLAQANVMRRRLEQELAACTCKETKATAAQQAQQLSALHDQLVTLEAQLAAAKLAGCAKQERQEVDGRLEEELNAHKVTRQQRDRFAEQFSELATLTSKLRRELHAAQERLAAAGLGDVPDPIPDTPRDSPTASGKGHTGLTTPTPTRTTSGAGTPSRTPLSDFDLRGLTDGLRSELSQSRGRPPNDLEVEELVLLLIQRVKEQGQKAIAERERQVMFWAGTSKSSHEKLQAQRVELERSLELYAASLRSSRNLLAEKLMSSSQRSPDAASAEKQKERRPTPALPSGSSFVTEAASASSAQSAGSTSFFW